MKKLWRGISILLLLLLLVLAIPTTSVQAAAKVKLNKTKVTLCEGKTTTLKVKGTKKKVTWTSSDKKVATVNKKGKVTAKKTGTATITAKVGSKKYKCRVTVEAKKKYEIVNGYVNTTVSSYKEACEVYEALGYKPWKFIDKGKDNIWYYCIINHTNNSDKGTHDEDFDAAEKEFIRRMNERGYSPFPFGRTSLIKTGDGRIYIPDASGGSWSIAAFGKKYMN